MCKEAKLVSFYFRMLMGRECNHPLDQGLGIDAASGDLAPPLGRDQLVESEVNHELAEEDAMEEEHYRRGIIDMYMIGCSLVFFMITT